LLDELRNITFEIGLELENTLRGEDVRNNLAFTCVVSAVTRVENATPNRDKSVVKVGLDGAVSVTIDGV
jgi:hypothetical protein